MSAPQDNKVRTMKQNHIKHVYISFLNLLKVTGELEIESLGLVHGDELARFFFLGGGDETGIIRRVTVIRGFAEYGRKLRRGYT